MCHMQLDTLGIYRTACHWGCCKDHMRVDYIGTCGMAGQSALSSTTSVSVGARLAKPGGSISGANCLEAMRSSFRRRSARSSVTGAGIICPNFRGDRNVRLHGKQIL